MKGKVTSLVLVGSAFAVAALTQDSSPSLLVGSRVFTALVTIVWFGAMGTGLYFWAKHSRQEPPPSGTAATQPDENLSLRQLAAALGHKETATAAETVGGDKEVVRPERAPEVSK
jgi:hypothetical protein